MDTQTSSENPLSPVSDEAITSTSSISPQALEGAIKRILKKRERVGYWEANINQWENNSFDRITYWDLPE